MTTEEQIKMIKEDLEHNKNYVFNYQPVLTEADFKSQSLRDIVGKCERMMVEFDPTIAQELVHQELRRRANELISSEYKKLSIQQLAELSAELNVTILEGLLKIKEVRLAQEASEYKTEYEVEHKSELKDKSELSAATTPVEPEQDVPSTDDSQGTDPTKSIASDYVEETPKKKNGSKASKSN